MHSPEPLAATRRRDFQPGSNLRGGATAAAWTFLLPTLSLRSVLCVGWPTPAAVGRLSQLTPSLVVIAPRDARQRQMLEGAASSGTIRVLDSLAEPPEPYDLAYLPRGASEIIGAPLATRSTRALATVGYEERRVPAIHRRPWTPLTGGAEARSLIVRLSPWLGEVRTAVPLEHRGASMYFASHGLEERWLRRVLTERGLPGVGMINHLPDLRLTRRVFRRQARLSFHDELHPASPPAYLRRIAASGGLDLATLGWGMSARVDYPSQKVLFYLFDKPARNAREPELAGAPTIIVKVSQEPGRSALLDTALGGLRALETTPFGTAGRAPVALFAGSEAGRTVVGERAVNGRPFTAVSDGAVDCHYARDALAGLTDLACQGARPAPAAAVGDALGDLLVRFHGAYRASRRCRDLLERELAGLASTGSDVPLVMTHGDPGPHNLIVSRAGAVTFVDWENAEPAGMPLWDVFAFLRGYSTWATRRARPVTRFAAVKRNFVEGTDYSRLIADSIERYRAALGLDRSLIKPLFYSWAMSLALREAPRLRPERLDDGHQFRLLEMLCEQSDAPVLRRMLQAEGPE